MRTMGHAPQRSNRGTPRARNRGKESMDPDLVTKLLIFAAVLVLIVIAGYQSDRLADLRYENEKLKHATRGQFKKKS